MCVFIELTGLLEQHAHGLIDTGYEEGTKECLDGWGSSTYKSEYRIMDGDTVIGFDYLSQPDNDTSSSSILIIDVCITVHHW